MDPPDRGAPERSRSTPSIRLRLLGTVLVPFLLIILPGIAAGAGPSRVGSPADPDPATVREEARRILERDEFHRGSLPRPLRAPLRWIGEQLEHLYRPIVRLLGPVVGERTVPWIVVGVAGAAVVLLATRFARARSRAEVRRHERRSLLVDPAGDPRRLEADADSAEAAGDHEAAIRLRHLAGLLRLVRAGRLDLRPETTARDAARAVDDPVLDGLTDLFESVVYGDREATGVAVAGAREAWRRVLTTTTGHPQRPEERVGRSGPPTPSSTARTDP